MNPQQYGRRQHMHDNGAGEREVPRAPSASPPPPTNAALTFPHTSLHLAMRPSLSDSGVRENVRSMLQKDKWSGG